MSKYTREVHVQRLIKMLALIDEEAVAWSCPATEGFDILGDNVLGADNDEVCIACRDFLDIPIKDEDECPCDYFESTKKAISATRAKLKEAGIK